jgi:hypothetical protein
MYNHITLALKDSHPTRYLSNHQRVHDFFVNEFGNLVSTTGNIINPVDLDSIVMEEEQEELVTDFGVNFL